MMKRTICTVLVIISCIILFSNKAYPQNQNNDVIEVSIDLNVVKVETDVFRVVHKFPFGGNSLLVKAIGNNFILVDTPYENSGTEALVKWLRINHGDINLIAINTHFHNDCLGGNGYLLDNGFKVYGSDMTVKLLREIGDDRRVSDFLKQSRFKRFYDILSTAKLVPPDNVFKASEGLNLDFGGEKIEIFYPGPGHSPDNLVVYFPERKILFGGCMIMALSRQNLGNLTDADVKSWPGSIANVIEKYSDSRVVIPGHGLHGGMGLLSYTLDLLEKNGK